MRGAVRDHDPVVLEPSLRLVTAAMLTSILGGLLAFFGTALDQGPVVVAGLSLTLTSAPTAGGSALLDARRTGRSYVGSLWLAVKTAVRWLFAYM